LNRSKEHHTQIKHLETKARKDLEETADLDEELQIEVLDCGNHSNVNLQDPRGSPSISQLNKIKTKISDSQGDDNNKETVNAEVKSEQQKLEADIDLGDQGKADINAKLDGNSSKGLDDELRRA
jgi:hypothetical protein